MPTRSVHEDEREEATSDGDRWWNLESFISPGALQEQLFRFTDPIGAYAPRWGVYVNDDDCCVLPRVSVAIQASVSFEALARSSEGRIRNNVARITQ